MSKDVIDLREAGRDTISDFLILLQSNRISLRPPIVLIDDAWGVKLSRVGYRRVPDVPNEYHKVVDEKDENDVNY